MTEKEEKAFILNSMFENFGKEASTGFLAMWLKLLENYSIEDVTKASLIVVNTYEYKTIPPFAVFKKELDKSLGIDKEKLDAIKNLLPEQAWEELEHLLETKGNKDEMPALEKRTLHALLRIGGWYNLCLCPLDELKWKKKNFIEIYKNSLDIEEDLLDCNTQTLGKILSLSESLTLLGLKQNPSKALAE